MVFVPCDKVYKCPCVRSTRAPRNSTLLIRMTATSSTARTASTPPVRSFLFFIIVPLCGHPDRTFQLIRFLQVDDDRAGVQPERDRQQEIDEIAQIDHALADRSEMAEEAQARNRIDESLRRPRVECGEHQRESGAQEQEDTTH